jgi:lipoate---protein ligase
MAIDEVVLTAHSRGEAPHTLRFLQFDPHCTLVGYHQAVEQEIRVDYCRDQGIDINRRLTGGGGLYWDTSALGWEIYAPQGHPAIPTQIEAMYELLCQAAVRGLARLGVQAAFRPKNDIEVDGRKISGTGGTALGGSFLFQGSLLVDFDVDVMLRALRIPTEKLKDKEIDSVKERVTCLKWELGSVPPLGEIKAALAAGFGETLGVGFEAAGLVPAEERLLEERLPFFESDEWVYGPRRSLDHQRELRAMYKSSGGLVRVALTVDEDGRRIRSALITGDFFAYPRRAIYDLEAALKNASARMPAVQEIVHNFWQESGIRIPGVTPEDVLHSIRQALDKLDYIRQDIAPEEVNDIYTVVRPLSEIRHSDILLLPYCAKLPACAYRYEAGCDQCGACCIGDAFALAERYGLRPISIQNYEDLEETLERLRDAGHEAFVGSCCEAFYAKHRDDFERIGLPGILVDVDSSTCYDLGQEQDAYAGRFENQTYLKLGLLERVVRRVSADGRQA